MKKCKICKIEKELDCFYKHPKMKDGFSQKCKDCSKKQSSSLYFNKIKDPVWYEKEKARHRKKQLKRNATIPANLKKIYQENYDKKYPEKKKARNCSQKLTPIIIGNELHHWSYNVEHYKDCIELSPKEHKKAHRYLIYDSERCMYRTTKGVLLDTKENHIKYITEKINNEQE